MNVDSVLGKRGLASEVEVMIIGSYKEWLGGVEFVV
jgi:hypothetical protein